MELKPGYKQTEVGVIPEDWEVHDLQEVVALQRGHDLTWRQRQGGSVPVMGSAGLNGYHNVAIANGPGVILGRSGASFGQAHYCDVDFWPHNTAMYVVDFKGNDTLYVFYFLKAIDFSRHNSGGAQQSLNRNFIARIRVPFPPLPEQKAIAKALSDMDSLLNGLDSLIAKKHDIKQATMQQLLTGKTRLPGFSGEWEVKRLGDVGKCIRGVSYKGDTDLSQSDGDYTKRLLRSNNVQNSAVVTQDLQYVIASRVSAHQILQADDVLICMANGSKVLVGKAAKFILDDGFEYTFGAFMGCFRTTATDVDKSYVFYHFLTERYSQLISVLLAGSSINNLTPSTIESFEIPFPPLPEQLAIAKVLTDMDAELEALEQRRDKTRELKQAMMQELLTGRTRLV